MKHTFIIVLFILFILTAYAIGMDNGRNHVIYDSEMFVLELPDRNDDGGFDEDEITVYLTIDGVTHEYGCTIG